MIYSRGGEPITLTRKATVEETMKEWGWVKSKSGGWRSAPRASHENSAAQDLKYATDRVGYSMMWWATYEDGAVRLVDAAMCKADGGWGEISDTINGTNEGSGT